ncbi:MAG: acyl-CoA thioesterase [Candidatus Marinimicrobia bacterium]|nr:acyl-CoA thioesterase [Candidatus Neomarinimicrobiota bacterium]
MKYAFRLDFKVRDYECDIQGIVNNGVYQNYLEHARHEYLLASGVDFAELAKNNVNLVVTRAELDYKTPLQSGDKFWIGLTARQSSKVRFEFLQDIYRSSDDRLVLKAKITGTSINERGRPFVPEEISGLFQEN